LPEAGGDLRVVVLVSEVGSEVSVFAGEEAGGASGEEEVDYGEMASGGGLHERGLVGGWVDGVGIGLMLEKEVGHAKVAMGGSVEEAVVERQGGLVIEEGFDEADFTLAGGEKHEGSELCGREVREGEEGAKEGFFAAAKGEFEEWGGGVGVGFFDGGAF
jgi:hypothetical protein